jgi:hypothetical protein
MITKKKPLIIIIGVILLLLVAFCLSLAGFFPWSRINCSTTDIELCSGRTRYTRYLFWIPVERTVSASALTKELSPKDLPGSQCEWQPVVTLSPRVRHSPHYVYHSALSQIRDLESIWKAKRIPKESRRADAIRLLRLWQKSGCREAQLFLDEKLKE